MAAPEPGTTLAGKYVVERVLGVGGMGVVVAARHLQLDQKVAIKYLLPDALANPEVVERFAREARAAAKIRGEHVARIIDVGNFDDGAPFMVLEYLDGENLEDLLARRGPLPISEAIGYVLETCEALAEAHAAGVVHRDLKPANLFLAKQPDRRSIVKVLDFGISKLVDPSSQGITKTSVIMGTPFYMSPEQLISTKDVDARSDIWALGVILYELLTRTKPFVGESMPEIIGAILTNEPERISSLRSEVTLDLELCIARCLASKVADRHASVKELAVALGPFAAPESRASIDKIARVLGDSLAPGSNEGGVMEVIPSSAVASALVPRVEGDSTAIVPSSAAAIAAATTEPATRGPAPAPKPAPAPASAVPAVTSHAVTSAVVTPPARTSPVLKIAIGIVVVTAAAGAALGLRTGPAATPVRDPVVAAPPEPTPTTPATVASSTTVILPALEPAAPDAAVAVTPSAAPAVAIAKGSSTARVAPHANAPPAVVASATAAVTAPPAPPPPATPASAAKNPLQMGIK